jgi:hypothetical protein
LISCNFPNIFTSGVGIDYSQERAAPVAHEPNPEEHVEKNSARGELMISVQGLDACQTLKIC